MGFLDELRKKNKLAKSLVQNGLAPNFDVAIKMVEAKMRVESGAQEPVDENRQFTGVPSTNLSDLKHVVQNNIKGLSIDEQKKASITSFETDKKLPNNIGVEIPKEEEVEKVSTVSKKQEKIHDEKPVQHVSRQRHDDSLTNSDIQHILSENTKFITEQMVEFKTQISSLAATVEIMQQEIAELKRKSVSSPKAETKEPLVREMAQEPKEAGNGEEKKHDGKDKKNSHPRSPSPDSEFKPEDVSIEKMFNFSNKKFD